MATHAGCRRDADGYYWITGRVDDVLMVSGHRIGTAEVESALVEHGAVVEAAIVGCPHPVKGESIYAFVVLRPGHQLSATLETELRNLVRRTIGGFAAPEHFQDASGGLPKTRSGKIMRRILRKIAHGDTSNLGDTSTLADPSVVPVLLQDGPRRQAHA